MRDVRGRGLMLGIECAHPEDAARASQRCLERGVIAIPSGARAEVLSLTPPLSIEEDILAAALGCVVECLP